MRIVIFSKIIFKTPQLNISKRNLTGQEKMEKNLALPLILAVIWTIPWKGVALWKAARRGQKVWFVLMLVLNTLAILEILYIFVFSKRDERQQG